LKRASTLTLVVSTDRSYRPHGLKKVVNAKANPNKTVIAKPATPAAKSKAKKAAPVEEVAVVSEGQAE